VESDPLNEDPLRFPVVAIYADAWGTSCGSITEIDSVGPADEFFNFTGVRHDSLNGEQLLIRISNAPIGEPGNFRINIEIKP